MKTNAVKNKMFNLIPVELIKNILIYNTMKTFYHIITRRTFNNFRYNKMFSYFNKIPNDPYIKNTLKKKCYICARDFNVFTGFNKDREYVCEYMNGYYSRHNNPVCNKCNTINELRDNINKKNNTFNEVYNNNLFVNKKYLIPEKLFSYMNDDYDLSYMPTLTRNLFKDLDYNDEDIIYHLEIFNNNEILEELYEVLMECYDGIMPSWILYKYFNKPHYIEIHNKNKKEKFNRDMDMINSFNGLTMEEIHNLIFNE